MASANCFLATKVVSINSCFHLEVTVDKSDQWNHIDFGHTFFRQSDLLKRLIFVYIAEQSQKRVASHARKNTIGALFFTITQEDDFNWQIDC